MKILALLSRFPYPLEKGDKLRAFYQLKYLGERHELEIICLAEGCPEQAHLDQVEAICTKLTVVSHSKWKVFFNAITAPFSSLPYQVSYFKNRLFRRHLSEAISKKGEEQPDVIYAQLVRTAAFIPIGNTIPVCLDYMDAFSLNMKRRSEHSAFPLGWFFDVESQRLQVLEQGLANRFAGFSSISKADSLAMNLNSTLIEIPNGVKEEYIKAGASIEQVHNSFTEKKDIDILFTGNMSYFPNVKAAEYLINKIMPIVWKTKPSVKVVLAGISPSPAVRELASDRVTVTGFVKDLVPYLQQAKLFVAPLFNGAGLQNKLLESMVMQLPSITSPVANASLNAVPGRDLELAENPEQFVRSILMLLDDESRRNELGKAGRDFVLANFSWRKSNELLEALLKNCVSSNTSVDTTVRIL